MGGRKDLIEVILAKDESKNLVAQKEDKLSKLFLYFGDPRKHALRENFNNEQSKE